MLISNYKFNKKSDHIKINPRVHSDIVLHTPETLVTVLVYVL